MNDQSQSNEAQGRPEAETAMDAAGSILQRRRLLRVVGASGALAGVGLPFSAHATVRPRCVKSGKNYHATASAVGSLIASVTGTTPPVAGHKCEHYRVVGAWGTGWHNGKGRNLSYDLCAKPSGSGRLKFWHVFELPPSSGDPKDRYCSEILNLYASSEEAVWLTAIFNANKRSPFTYTPSNVVDLYHGRNPLMGGMIQSDIRLRAHELFRDYLSDQS